jgi:phage terminase large subunit-like protein
MPRVRRVALRRTGAQHDPIGAALEGLTGGARVIRFMERFLRHGKGKYAGRAFEPLPFQRELIHGLYDPVDARGLRMIRSGLALWPRKQGKTTTAAGLGLYETFCRGIGSQAVCAANSRDQAALLFNPAADMVEACPDLAARAVVSRAKKTITDRLTRSTFRVISADAPTAHGLDLTFWIYDELHAAPNRELFDVLDTSTGAREEALGLVISTAGFDKLSILGEIYDHAKRVQLDPSLDRHFYAHILESGPDDPWDSEETWRKANPALGEFRELEEMRLMAKRARQIPARIDAFKRLYLNRWTQVESSWLDAAAWDACDAKVDESELLGVPCFGGLDMSATTDLTAFALVFHVDDRLVVRHWAWIPEDDIAERERRDRVPYRQWADAGLIELTPGNCIDSRLIIQRVIALSERFNIKRVSFDRWGARQVVQALQDAGVEVADMGQGFAAMNAPSKELERAVLSRQLAHGGCSLLRWQATQATVKTDPSGAIRVAKPDRMKHARRVDSVVALVMALDGVLRCRQTNWDQVLSHPLVA